MTTQRDSLDEHVRGIRGEIGSLLEGMDYCLDWKPSDEEWSAREIIYHVVETPSGGIHKAVQGVLQRGITELTVVTSLTNMTPERQGKDLGQVSDDLEAVFAGLGSALVSATDAELTDRSASVHFVTRAAIEQRTAHSLISGIFARHWREHLAQLAEIREMLGFE